MGNMTSECLLQNIVAQIHLAKATRKFEDDSKIEVFLNDRAYSVLIPLLHLNRFSYSTDIEIYGHKVHVVNDVDCGFPKFWLGEQQPIYVSDGGLKFAIVEED